MTLDELEKLETLHAAAPPGEWAAERAERVAALGEALHNAFPALAKALREAWANVKHWKNQWQQMANLANENLTALKAAERERDEARAEITRLCDLVTQAAVSEPVQANLPFNLIPTDHWNRIRAEAERLSRKDDK